MAQIARFAEMQERLRDRNARFAEMQERLSDQMREALLQIAQDNNWDQFHAILRNPLLKNRLTNLYLSWTFVPHFLPHLDRAFRVIRLLRASGYYFHSSDYHDLTRLGSEATQEQKDLARSLIRFMGYQTYSCALCSRKVQGGLGGYEPLEE